MSAKKIIKSEKKELILLASIKVFAKKGINGATIKEIAVSAGIGKGTIYEYFTDKNEIISCSFQYFMNLFDKGIEEILLEDTDSKHKLIDIVNYIICFVGDDKSGILNLIFDFWAESIKSMNTKGLIFNEMKNFYQSYRRLISDIIKDGEKEGGFSGNIDENSMASILIGMLDGLMVQWIIDRENVNLSSINAELKKLIEKGMN